MRAVVVTGSHGGIGRALCAAFRRAGYRVIGIDHPDAPPVPPGTECADSEVLVDLIAFVRDGKARNRTLADVQGACVGAPLHALVNNAATQRLGGLAALQLEDLEATLAVNVTAPLLLAQGLLPELVRASGSVINIGSIHARATKPGFISYATSKAALVGLTRALAVDLGGQVRVNAICPGAIGTPMLEAGFAGRGRQRSELDRFHPRGQIGQVAEVADVAVFLASGGAANITGAEIMVDGGISARLHDPD